MRSHGDGRSAAPVILVASRLLLSRRFGVAGWQAVDEALVQLAQSLRPLSAHLLYVDDARSLAPYGLSPVTPRDPQLIRQLVDQLERNLGGAPAIVWLIGGDEVLPFFRLTNPADDPDGEILSDAPYASSGGDPLVPSRVVARLPHPAGGANAFLHLLARAASAQPIQPRQGTPVAVGYTASIWREASQAVLSEIPGAGPLRMSPPWELHDYPYVRRQHATLRYFNLHGTAEGTTWHGQLDPVLPADFDDFPPALRQIDISADEARDSVVAAEACYGAALTPTSIAMRFLRLGAGALLGSTAMSYGALASPVSGADLLVKDFLQLVVAGVPLGEALLLAKLAFARTMMDTQGFLDAEDQKTLLTFVLLGHPTLRLAVGSPQSQSHLACAEAYRHLDGPLDVVCAHTVDRSGAPIPEGSLLKEIESLAQYHLAAHPRSLGFRQETCRIMAPSTHSRPTSDSHQVVSLSRPLSSGGTQVVRFTVREGRVTKTVVSH
ncbi:MAG: hypothetical protein HPY83_01480 [Anaerolineae bacterium]|nr:hypothetical protein [Anaerolineae bacterium]